MANDRVCFVPWNRADAPVFQAEIIKNNANRPNTHHKRAWTPVFFDDAHPNGVIANMGTGWGTRLHIFGHGGAGDPIISNEDGQTLNEVGLVNRLVAHGFKKYYTGTVVVDVCQSALGKPGHPPFAKLFARELWQRGYKLCCVMGFKGDLGAVYEDLNAYAGQDGHQHDHRVVDLPSGQTVKSKDAKERFFGFG